MKQHLPKKLLSLLLVVALLLVSPFLSAQPVRQAAFAFNRRITAPFPVAF